MGNIGRSRVVFTGIPAGPGVATHFFRLDAAWNWAGYADNLRDGLYNSYGLLAPIIPDDISYTVKADVDILDEETGELQATYTGEDRTDNFTSTSGFAPLGVGFCVTWRSVGIVNSKHVRGRTFIVPVGSDVIYMDGTPTDASLVTVAAWAASIEGALMPYGDLVVWSRPRTGRAGSAHEVAQHTIADKFAVLRSRRD